LSHRRSCKPFSFWMPNGSCKFPQFSVFCKVASQSPYVTNPPHASHLKTQHRICIKLRINLWQKWGGQLDMSTPVHHVATPLVTGLLEQTDGIIASCFRRLLRWSHSSIHWRVAVTPCAAASVWNGRSLAASPRTACRRSKPQC